MGSGKSKNEGAEVAGEAGDDDLGDEVQVFWDVNGVLRTKPVMARHKPARELQLVNKLEAQHRTWAPGQTFYLIHTQWLEGWLQYVRTSGAGAPQPAAVSNDKLLVHDAEGNPQAELRPGRRSPRHFRLLTEQVWVVYSHLYGVSGATITVAAPSEAEAADMVAEAREAEEVAQNAAEEKRKNESGKDGEEKKSKGGFFDTAMNPIQANSSAQAPSTDEVDNALGGPVDYNPYEDFGWEKLSQIDRYCSIVMVDEDGEEKDDN